MLFDASIQHEIAVVAQSSATYSSCSARWLACRPSATECIAQFGATHSSCSANETGQVAARPYIEWAQNIQKIELPFEALAKMYELAESAPQPSARLRAAAKRYR